MKKTGFLFVALLSIFTANSQTNTNVILHTTGALQTTSISSIDNCFVANTTSGDNLVASNIKVGSLSYINIKKIHSDGSVSTIVNIETSAPVKGLTCSSSGNFTCFFGSLSSYCISKFTSTGATLWTKSLSLPMTTSPSEYFKNTINENASGEYYVTVSLINCITIIKLDANGNPMWNRKYVGPNSAVKSPGFCTAITNSGGCISTMKDQYYVCVINTASDGTLIWSKSYVDVGTYRWPRSIKADNMGNFYILGTYDTDGTSFIAKIDAAGNFIYAKNIGIPLTTGSTDTKYLDSHISASNELYLIASRPEFVVAKVNASGYIDWNKKIEGTLESYSYYLGTNFAKMPSANISFVSFVDDSTNMITNFSGNPAELCYSTDKTSPPIFDDSGLLGAEIDTLLSVSTLPFTLTNTTIATTTIEYYLSEDYCNPMSINKITTVDLNLYPNPATDFINIELSNLKNIDLQNAVLIVYDITGKKVFEKQLNSYGMNKILTTHYAAGLYTIMIANSDTILAKQRVIVQK